MQRVWLFFMVVRAVVDQYWRHNLQLHSTGGFCIQWKFINGLVISPSVSCAVYIHAMMFLISWNICWLVRIHRYFCSKVWTLAWSVKTKFQNVIKQLSGAQENLKKHSFLHVSALCFIALVLSSGIGAHVKWCSSLWWKMKQKVLFPHYLNILK